MHAEPESAFLTFTHVKKTYDQKTLVVRDFNLDVRQGEFVTLLGPSGSGKTTVLMMLAGFEHLTSGQILLRGQPLDRTAPHLRNIGMVFQNYALFPHMTVAQNLAYPLTVRKWSRTRIRERVDEYLRLIELHDYGERMPAQLSGGQRQRVALARALVFEPELVLMDEPLGALDKKLREQMQFEITRLHKQLGCTVVYVTHDQAEALTMSDRIAVFNRGQVQQYDSPSLLYEQPANAFVASFIGENNLVPARAPAAAGSGLIRAQVGGQAEVTALDGDGCAGQDDCVISIRPEKLTIVPHDDTRCDNRVPARFVTRHYVGDFIRYYFQLHDGPQAVVKVLNGAQAPALSPQQPVWLGWMAGDSHAFKNDTHHQPHPESKHA